jgi:hypothetical protein
VVYTIVGEKLSSTWRLRRFFTEFDDTFDETDRDWIVITKLRLLHQGSHPASVYATDFPQVAYDVDWDENTFISVFH